MANLLILMWILTIINVYLIYKTAFIQIILSIYNKKKSHSVIKNKQTKIYLHYAERVCRFYIFLKHRIKINAFKKILSHKNI